MKTALIIIFPLIAVLGPAAELAGQSAFGAPVVVESEWWYNTTPVFIQNSGDIISPSAPSNSVTIQGNSQVVFTSATEIVLNPGFEVSALSGEGYFHAFIDQEMNDFEVVAINAHPPNFEVGEYEKLELGIKLPELIIMQIHNFFSSCTDITDPDCEFDETEGINPYNYNDITIQATFISPNGDTYQKDGFFFRECRRGTQYPDTWEEVPTDYSFRIRFAPNVTGIWTCSVKIVSPENSFPQYNSGPFTFHCIPSDNPGYIEVGHHKRYFRFSKTKQTFFPIGINTPSPSLGGHLTPDRAQLQMDLLTDISIHGGNTASLAFIRDVYGYEMEHLGVYDIYYAPEWSSVRNRQFEAREADWLVDHASEKGIYLKTWVTPHQHWCTGTSDCIYTLSPYYDPGDYCAFFNNPELRMKYKNYLRYMIARWGYSTQILWWEVVSEIDKIGCFNTGNFWDVSLWAVDLTNYFRSLDPNHMTSSSFSFTDCLSGDDFWNLHLYGLSEDINLYRAHHVKTFLDNNDIKPVLLGEAGESGEDGAGIDVYTAVESCHPISFHNMIWATAMMGCAGTGLNWHWNELYSNGYLSEMKYLSDFIRDEDFESNQYTAHVYKSDNIINDADYFESYQLINHDKTRGLGWVHNRSFYWYSVANCTFNGISITPNDDDPPHFRNTRSINGTQVKIKNLKANRRYRIIWYSTNPPLTTYSSVFTSNLSGVVDAYMPETNISNPDWAYKIIEEENKSRLPDIRASSELNENKAPQETGGEHTFCISPNPCSEFIEVINSQSVAYNLTIYDFFGNEIQTIHAVTNPKIKIDMTSHANGVYVFRFENSDSVHVHKIIKCD